MGALEGQRSPISSQTWGKGCRGNRGGWWSYTDDPSSGKLEDQRFDVQHSKSEARKGKGRNHEAKSKDEEAKPVPAHGWPTLGVKPGNVANVSGTAWGKAGGAVKHLKEAEEMKNVKEREQKLEGEEEEDEEEDEAAQ